MMTILYFIFAAIALGILVFIHELGHYFAARWVGMRVEIFSIGFGKPILKWRVQDVDWQLGWLPFGGYVKIAGMDVSKKEKNNIEPREVSDGFFDKAPWKRIIVAIAGPVSNFILAIILFSILWMAGGREKPFAEFTRKIGWVDPQSEAYAQGIRPGDLLTGYDGKSYTNSKELIYAAMLGDKKVRLKGYHVLYDQGQNKIPFDYSVATYQAPNTLNGILTTGILSSGKYLIYAPFSNGTPNPIPAGSPMENSGIQYGDRIVWADGELIFSMDQLSYLINDRRALLTIQRGDKRFLARIPRVHVGDLILSSELREEVSDWQFEAGIKTKFQHLLILPYNITTDCVVRDPLHFIDKEAYEESFSKNETSPHLEVSLNQGTLNQGALNQGDKILAVDGVPVSSAYQLLGLLQKHLAQIIVERGQTLNGKVSWKNEDALFDQSVDFKNLYELTQGIGLQGPNQLGNLTLLKPVQPKKIDQFVLSGDAKELMESEIAKQTKQIVEIKDPEKRSRALNHFNENQNKLLLGVYLQDKSVNYNPTPLALFGDVFSETWHTLKALVSGYLSPKWLSGPIGIVQVIHHGWTIGFTEALFWIGAISLNLGFLNLLPLPVLDGGYICLALWETVTGKRLKAKTIERLIIPFVVLLIGLLIFLTFQDLSRIF